MQTRLRSKLLITSVSVAAGSLLLAQLLVGPRPPDGGGPGGGTEANSRAITGTAIALTIPLALLASSLASASYSRRAQAIAAMAPRYASGELSHRVNDFGHDELGEVARALDAAMRDLGRQLEELARDRARMEAILAAVGEGVLAVDRAGRLQLVNRAARAMLHVDAAAVGRPYLEVVRHPDVAAYLTASLEGQNVETQDLVFSREQGRAFVARAAAVGGSGGGAVLVLHDMTDLRRADQIRRDFVANVSHELRTPLTAIRGCVEALHDEIGSPGSGRAICQPPTWSSAVAGSRSIESTAPAGNGVVDIRPVRT